MELIALRPLVLVRLRPLVWEEEAREEGAQEMLHRPKFEDRLPKRAFPGFGFGFRFWFKASGEIECWRTYR